MSYSHSERSPPAPEGRPGSRLAPSGLAGRLPGPVGPGGGLLGHLALDNGPNAAAGLPVYPPQPGLGMSYPQAVSLVYINEAQLRAIRAESRRLSLGNPFCIGAGRNRIAYTVGKGHTYKCSLVDKDALTPEQGEELLEPAAT